MFKNWEKIECGAELGEKVSLYKFAEKDHYLVRHFPFGFMKLDREHVKALTAISASGGASSPVSATEEILSYINKDEKHVEPGTRSLRRLNLIVAQKCNCRCRYCYAGEGNYGAEGFMSLEIAIKAIDSAFDGYDQVQNIQFFGGEPLLAPELIEKSMAYAEQAAAARGKETPSFTAVTNLTCLPENIFSLVKSGKLNIITSLDGPKEVHDANRIFCGGAPTYEAVAENIRKLGPYSQPKTIEATYTKAHLEKGITPLDIKKHISGLSPSAAVVVVPQLGLTLEETGAVSHSELSHFWASGSDPKDENVKKVVGRYLRLVKGAPRRDMFCDLGRSNFTVDAVGNIWPCQVLCGKSEPIGKAGEKFSAVKERFEAGAGAEMLKSKHSRCRKCFLRNYCTSCPAAWDKEGGVPSPAHSRCELDRVAYLTAFLLAFKAQKGETNVQF